MTRRSTRLAGVLGVAAAICTASGLASAVPASPSRPPLSVSLDGEAFTTHPTRSLRGDDLAPGRSASTVVGLRSGVDADAAVALQLLPSGTASVALRRAVRVTVWTADADGTARRRVWTGTATELEDRTRVGIDLASRSDRWLRIVAAVPSSAGNEVADQSFGFGLRVALAGTGLGVDAVSTGTGNEGAGVDADTDGPLSFTGVPLALLAAAAGLLLAAGAVVLIAARRRASDVMFRPERPALSA